MKSKYLVAASIAALSLAATADVLAPSSTGPYVGGSIGASNFPDTVNGASVASGNTVAGKLA